MNTTHAGCCSIICRSRASEMATSSFNCPPNIVEHIVDQLFLPRRMTVVPAVPAVELIILKWMAHTLDQTDGAQGISAHTKRLFKNMVSIHCDGAMNIQTIAAQIDSAAPGDMFGMFVRPQNCCVLIHTPKKHECNELMMTTFHTTLPRHLDAEISIGVMVRPRRFDRYSFSYSNLSPSNIDSFALRSIGSVSRAIRLHTHTEATYEYTIKGQ